VGGKTGRGRNLLQRLWKQKGRCKALDGMGGGGWAVRTLTISWQKVGNVVFDKKLPVEIMILARFVQCLRVF